jgi:hypothetical protein
LYIVAIPLKLNIIARWSCDYDLIITWRKTGVRSISGYWKRASRAYYYDVDLYRTIAGICLRDSNGSEYVIASGNLDLSKHGRSSGTDRVLQSKRNAMLIGRGELTVLRKGPVERRPTRPASTDRDRIIPPGDAVGICIHWRLNR